MLFFTGTMMPLMLVSQTVIYEDNFSNNCNAGTNGLTPCANGEAPNNTTWRYSENDGGFALGYTFTNNEMRLRNNWGSGSSSGLQFMSKRLAGNSSIGTNEVYGTWSTSNPNHLDDVFTNNTQTIEWTFLFYLSQTPTGLSNGAARYGGAFVLGSVYNNLQLCNTSLRNKGYAVFFGSQSTNQIHLAHFESGTSSACATNNYPQYMINNTFGTDNTTCIISDDSQAMSGARWYAVKVQYNPANDEWRLFTRHNVSSTFDPTTLGTADGRGSNIDNTHTNVQWLSYMGLYASMPATTPTRSVRLKSLKIRKNVSLIATPAGGGFCTSMAALPVEFNQLSSTCMNGQAHLNWSTFTELNNDYFTIERSSDGYVFEEIAQVSGNGTTNQLSAYQWVDDRPFPGVSYYRLSQTDYDGTYTLLKTISYVHECAEIDYSISVYPNPMTEQSMVKLTLENESDVQLQLIDNSGRLVAGVLPMIKKPAGVYEWSLSNYHLAAGVYFLQLIVNHKLETIKIVK